MYLVAYLSIISFNKSIIEVFQKHINLTKEFFEDRAINLEIYRLNFFLIVA